MVTICPPAGTKAENIATLAYMPDETNKVDSALSSALLKDKVALNYSVDQQTE